tara:strand:+ start:293 stop:805 length:513 start_codon:yes stop_codon:yes gene_type:complete
MAAPNNPAGSSTLAGNTMRVSQPISGGRTRNVINIVRPGSTGTKAYEFEDTTSAPGSATDGYANFHSQKTLHIAAYNGADQTITLKFWFYNSSLGGGSGGWYELSQIERTHNGNTLVFATLPTPTLTAEGGTLRLILPIEGVERIAVQCTAKGGTVSSGTCDVYLGVNTI